MRVKKAVITAAAEHQRNLNVQQLVDRDGTSKSVLAILAAEILDAGVSDIAVIVYPGDEALYAEAVGPLARHMQFIPQQPASQGYGHAIQSAADFTENEPFLLTVSDHLYTSSIDKSCTAQLLATAEREKCAVSAVESTHESQLPYYGCIGGTRVQGTDRLYEIKTVIEKPTPTEAEQKLVVPGLRSGNYLAFLGMHILTPSVMQTLSKQYAEGVADLSSAVESAIQHERFLAYEIHGHRHDVDRRYGILDTQLALALSGKDRDEVLSLIIKQLAQSKA